MRHDPRTLRDHRIALNLTQDEYRAVTTTAALTGMDTAVVARQILMNQIRKLLLGEQPITLYIPARSTPAHPFRHSGTAVSIEAMVHA